MLGQLNKLTTDQMLYTLGRLGYRVEVINYYDHTTDEEYLRVAVMIGDEEEAFGAADTFVAALQDAYERTPELEPMFRDREQTP